MLSVGLCTQLACIWEATARKPGNVHRCADFADVTYLDFLLSAAAIAPVMETAPQRRPGATILRAVEATQQVTARNTNLGIILLLAPLAAVPPEQDLRTGLVPVLEGLDEVDARLAYQAIRLARPGGLGHAPDQDVAAEPTQSLRQVMALAAERDLVARQYANGFAEVLDFGLQALQQGLAYAGCLESAIIHCHLQFMASFPDSLIARKCGANEAAEASRQARAVLDLNWPASAASQEALSALDRWLRARGNQRNPGTSADLVTASLFAALRTGRIPLSAQFGRAQEKS